MGRVRIHPPGKPAARGVRASSADPIDDVHHVKALNLRQRIAAALGLGLCVDGGSDVRAAGGCWDAWRVRQKKRGPQRRRPGFASACRLLSLLCDGPHRHRLSRLAHARRVRRSVSPLCGRFGPNRPLGLSERRSALAAGDRHAANRSEARDARDPETTSQAPKSAWGDEVGPHAACRQAAGDAVSRAPETVRGGAVSRRSACDSSSA